MSKPPPDVDPEQFILGRGSYHNFQVSRAHFDEDVFRIDPTPTPVWAIVILNAIFVSFFGVMYWLAGRAHGGLQALEKLAIIGTGVIVCIGFAAASVLIFRRENQRGPWLVYDKRTKRLELPRERVSFARDEIVHVQYITTKDLSWGDDAGNERRSELNLVTVRDGQRKRWPLLRSIFTHKAFDHVVKPLLRHTDLPVVRVEDQWAGWRVTESPLKR